MGRLSLRARDSVFSACLVGVLAVLSAGGCKTLTPEQQFEPVPVATVESQELEPAAPPSVVELIRAAQDAFEAGNADQERGENAAALRQYSLMLELLVEADLDPKIFYNLKDQFAAILESTAQQAPLYERMRPPHAGEVAYGSEGISDLTIEFPLADRVLTEIDEIQKLYPKNFQAGLNRSTKYIPHIQAKLAEAGLPQDLVWLVMVESQFTPKIISRAGAGGMWQFMRTTGRRYNLRIDSYVDERFNWCKSTDAAVQFLTDLYEMFDTWPLAISAYNMGEGGLERAIAANGGERDLWTLLDTPPAAYQIQLETKKFYAKLLASIIVAKN
ncbi:MAG: rane-bound lytic murein transglycosylase, partial [Candidatus Hydrogenedentes bacterium]|nr:rane-bound lytic murein transglycosylase [Candidatus Hydrogenedentota bacterium]